MSDSDDDDLSPHQIQKRKTQQIISTLSNEQMQRLQFFRSQCKLPTSKVKEIMKEELPPGSSINQEVAIMASKAAKLFIAELVETAKKYTTENTPITPDLIYIAYADLARQRKIPGMISGLPVPEKRL